MPRLRKDKDVSPPTIKKWLQAYLVEIQEQIKDGRMYEEEGRQIAKGMRYSIRWIDKSYARYKNEKRNAEQKKYEEALEFFDD